MAVEAIDARHEALLCIERARIAIEAGELDNAEHNVDAARHWIRAITPAHSLEWDDLSPEAKAAWQYRP